jgi:flagellar hook-associated protein 2
MEKASRMSITPLAFTGISSYSQDFQTILQRAVDIASLPIKALQNDQTTILGQTQSLSDLGGSVAALASQLRQLTDLGSGGSVVAESSDTGLVTATAGTTAQPGLYVVSEITSIASVAASTSKSGLATADGTSVAGDGKYLQLVVGGRSFDLNLTDATDNLNSVSDIINGLGAGVTASVLWTGSGEAASFLTVTATATGEQSIELRTVKDAPGTDLLATVSAGSNAQFRINGKDLVRSSNTITDAVAGVTFNLRAKTQPSETATISLSSNRSAVKSALESFLTSYNELAKKLDGQIGENAGLLSGDPIVGQMSARLRELMSARGSETGQTLSDLGVRFDKEGVATLESGVLEGLSSAQWASALRWLGDETGGLAVWNSTLSSVTDPVSGIFSVAKSGLMATDERITRHVAEMTERVQTMQRSLFDRLQAADATLARLDGQQSILTASLEALNLVMYGKRTNN